MLQVEGVMKEELTKRVYLVDYAYSWQFFLRIITADRISQHLVVTPLISVYLQAKASPYVEDAFYVSRFGSSDICLVLDVSQTKEVCLGMLTEGLAKQYLCYVVSQLLKIISSNQYCRFTFVLWNGDSVLGVAARYIRDEFLEYMVDTAFFEISNLPGKVFCDPYGVNMASKLYQDASKLLNDSFDPILFENWKMSYLERKLSGDQPPQAALASKISWKNLLDYIASFICGYRLFSNKSLRVKLWGLVRPLVNTLKFDDGIKLNDRTELLAGEEFVFFPMQVSTDTQVIINSDVDNIGALEKILSRTKKNVIVKPHPVEKDLGYLYRFITQSGEQERIIVSFENTYKLISQADEVFVINSTVGFEAMLMSKPVTFFGRSFYTYFTSRMLGSYVMNYLLDADFFDEKDQISQAVISSMDERASQSRGCV